MPYTPTSLPQRDMLTEQQAAAYLSIEPKKLRRMGYDRKGPPSIKFGRDRRYPREGFLAWLAEREPKI